MVVIAEFHCNNKNTLLKSGTDICVKNDREWKTIRQCQFLMANYKYIW